MKNTLNFANFHEKYIKFYVYVHKYTFYKYIKFNVM